MAVRRVLFLCSRNRLRSPTAESVFGTRTDLEVASAGLAPDAEEPVTPELLDWAEIIFVMEKRHRAALSRRFRRHVGHARILCLDIPDDFDFMDPRLVALLNARAGPHLR
ncbi:low molecular weight protein tyrosine phosphatase family protein [Chenggangzhangella methanolivorans]|uniref:Phosphotyrosine protein phosphatase n=1 Tax=Chenggangzhangella methanolivorans TaxID=1437009 RepID=A0A9E6RF58_9HYPH|nr:phosphotyrosine protein phosphatase [Chenggangzhangella methanolivorans]QZO00096.1 phosphotyrosine protein phosphatase [Chenggangzhangella methanolivorans]